MKQVQRVFSVLFLFFIFTISSTVLAQPPLDDAVVLTLRIQKEGVFLDSILVKKINSVLSLARATKDTLKHIHTFPEYVPTEVIVSSSAAWTENWKKGILITGNAWIDMLSSRYHLINASYKFSSFYVLKFAQPLHIKNLVKLYKQDSTIIYAESNGYIGDGNNIWLYEKDSTWLCIFSEGWGDCPAGCIERNYWYVSVKNDIAQFEEMQIGNYTKPTIYRWNIPEMYEPLYYNSLTELFSKGKSSLNWWERRYAVEALGYLFRNEYPRISGHLPDVLVRYVAMKKDAFVRKNECVAFLRAMLNDVDRWVRRSAIAQLDFFLGNGSNSSSYFPLQVGNTWTWNSLIRKDSIEKIIDTVRIGGNKYFRFNHYRNLDSILVRRNEKNQILLRKDSSDLVWLDFSAEAGTSWNFPSFNEPSWQITLLSKDDTVKFNGKVLTHCYEFMYGGNIDAGWTEWFAPGLGCVKREQITLHGADWIFLQNANIDSVQIVTAVSSSHSEVISQFFLNQNYPNPFNPTTVISYRLVGSSFVILKVYDVLGKEIATLVNEQKETGTYKVKFDATKISSGIYFYKLNAGNFTEVKKMQVLK